MTNNWKNTDAYRLFTPQTQGCAVVFASPHSGRSYSIDFKNKSILDSLTLRSSEDAFVDELTTPAADLGAPLLFATQPRAFLDLNRAADELDPALIIGVKSRGLNPRITSGLGVIPRVVAHGRPIYHGKLPSSEANERITQFWTPYHEVLGDLLTETRLMFGHAVLIDMHSMPHEAIENMGQRGSRPEIVLGDRFGSSAAQPIVNALEEALTAQGFKVARNAPFAGAYITQRYGRPSSNYHAIQLELDRRMYLNEETLEVTDQFHDVRAALFGAFSEFTKGHQRAKDMAAE